MVDVTCAPRPSDESIGREGPFRVLLLPLILTLAFLGMSFLPRIHGNSHLRWSFWGFGFALLVWMSILNMTARRKRRRLRTKFVLQKNQWQDSDRPANNVLRSHT